MGCDSFRIDHGFIRRDVQMQVLLVDAPERAQVGPERCASSFTGVAVDLASAIPISIPRPFMHTVVDSGMGRMAATIALPCIGIEPRAASRNVFGDEVVAGPRVRVVAHPKARLARLARDHTDDGGTIVGIGAVPLALISASAWRIAGVAMGRTCFPPRSDIVHRPQRPCRSSPRSTRYRSG